MSAHADLPAGMLCPHVEACKVWPQAWKFQSGTWKEVRGIGVQCPNMHAEHREVYGSQGLLAPLMKSPRQRQAWGRGACLRNAGHTRLLLGVSEGFPVLEPEQPPQAAVFMAPAGGDSGEGTMLRGPPFWMAWDAEVHFAVLLAAGGARPASPPACSTQARTFPGTHVAAPRGLRTGCGTWGRLGR